MQGAGGRGQGASGLRLLGISILGLGVLAYWVPGGSSGFGLRVSLVCAGSLVSSFSDARRHWFSELGSWLRIAARRCRNRIV